MSTMGLFPLLPDLGASLGRFEMPRSCKSLVESPSNAAVAYPVLASSHPFSTPLHRSLMAL